MQQNQILTNVIMFVPVGMLSGLLWKWRGLWVAAGLSIVIELLQLVTSRGLCEFDDVLHNLIGAVIGTTSYIVIKQLNRMRKPKIWQ